ncbi:MAG: TIGR03905 family TSCPD domain-containing protein [Firmicutes bacterium]|nr:TIGR03905 family TSCPD domain-containing protein [Bacillota bacterium]
MLYTYTPKRVCSQQIQFEIDNGIVKNVSFAGGCNGNLKGISALVEGLPWDEVVKRLSGITCGFKNTSCPDQLAAAIKGAMEE